MTFVRAVVGAIAVVTFASISEAQVRPNRQVPGRGGQPGRPDPRRADLEDEVRRNFARAVRERVGLSDEQMLKLGPITRKFEDQRRQVQGDERDARTKLMGLVMVNAEGDSVRIKEQITALNDVRRRRMQIDEAEQKDLSTIMTPLQLAKFLGLQEQVRRRLEQARPFPGGQDGPPDGMPRGRGPDTPPDESFVVRFAVQPLRGVIRVDSVERGTGRQAVALPVGWHAVTFSAAGCETLTDSVLVTRRAMSPMMRVLKSNGADCK